MFLAEDIQQEINSWFNEWSNNENKRHLLIINNSYFPNENIFSTVLVDIPRECLFLPDKKTVNNLFCLNFDMFNQSFHKVIYVNDFTPHINECIKFISDFKISNLSVPSIFVTKDILLMTRKKQKLLENLFKIVFLERTSFLNQEENVIYSNRVKILNKEFSKVKKLKKENSIELNEDKNSKNNEKQDFLLFNKCNLI